MSMKEPQREASPDLDSGWDELESLSPPARPRREADDDFASIFAVDEGWDAEHPAAKPATPVLRSPTVSAARTAAASPAPLSNSTGPSQPPPRTPEKRAVARELGGLSKKQRRELERKGRAHAVRTQAERKEQAKSERKQRRDAEQRRLSAERAQAEAARRAEAELRRQSEKAAKPKPSPKRLPSTASEKPRVDPTPVVTRAQRKLEQKLESKKTGREKSRFAADLSPWLFAVAILAIVVVLAVLRH